MKAETVIVSRLTTVAGVTDLIGASPFRLYPLVLPQESERKYPAMTYKVIDSERTRGVYTDPGESKVRLQLTCWAETYNEAKALAEQVRLALERFGSGPLGTLIAGVTVYDIFMGSEADTYEPSVQAYAVAVDYTVVHAE